MSVSWGFHGDGRAPSRSVGCGNRCFAAETGSPLPAAAGEAGGGGEEQEGGRGGFGHLNHVAKDSDIVEEQRRGVGTRPGDVAIDADRRGGG